MRAQIDKERREQRRLLHSHDSLCGASPVLVFFETDYTPTNELSVHVFVPPEKGERSNERTREDKQAPSTDESEERLSSGINMNCRRFFLFFVSFFWQNFDHVGREGVLLLLLSRPNGPWRLSHNLLSSRLPSPALVCGCVCFGECFLYVRARCAVCVSTIGPSLGLGGRREAKTREDKQAPSTDESEERLSSGINMNCRRSFYAFSSSA